MPIVNDLADWLTSFDQGGDEEVKKCGNETYPGSGWCRPVIPHAKWHEQTANAFYDMMSLGEYLAEIYKSEEWRLGLNEGLDETAALTFMDDESSNDPQSDKSSPLVLDVDQDPSSAGPLLVSLFFWRSVCGLVTSLLLVSIINSFRLAGELRKLQASRAVGGPLKEGLL